MAPINSTITLKRNSGGAETDVITTTTWDPAASKKGHSNTESWWPAVQINPALPGPASDYSVHATGSGWHSAPTAQWEINGDGTIHRILMIEDGR